MGKLKFIEMKLQREFQKEKLQIEIYRLLVFFNRRQEVATTKVGTGTSCKIFLQSGK